MDLINEYLNLHTKLRNRIFRNRKAWRAGMAIAARSLSTAPV